jgi:hypothetical protein
MDIAILLLKINAAMTMIVFGMSQLKSPTVWAAEYIPVWMGRISTITPGTMMRVQAVGNLMFGSLLVSGLIPIAAAWIAFAWWISMLPFAFTYNWKIGMRDVSLVISLLALIYLISN